MLMVVLSIGAYVSELRDSLTPDLTILPSASVDIGAIAQGSSRNLFFEIKNPGKEVIDIIDVQVSCSCSSVQISKSNLQPGESVKLEFKYSSGSRRGTIDASSSIRYCSPAIPSVFEKRIKVTGRITPEYRVEPEVLKAFSETCDVQAIVMEGDGLEVEGVTCDKSYFDVSLEKIEFSRYIVKVRFDHSLYYNGAGVGRLTIRTNSKVQPIVEVLLGVKRDS
jgi:hypothetical protein